MIKFDSLTTTMFFRKQPRFKTESAEAERRAGKSANLGLSGLPFSRKSIALAALLALAGCSKTEDNKASAASPVNIETVSAPAVSASSERPPEAKSVTKPLNLEAVKALKLSPDAGSIMESSLENPGKKTVIYIVDEHAAPGGTESFNMSSREAQKALFKVLEEIATQSGARLPVVLENFPSDQGGRKFTLQDVVSLLTEAELQDPAKREILLAIQNERNQEKRRDLILEAITKFDVPGTVFFDLAHPEEMRAIGSVSYNDLMVVAADSEDLPTAFNISDQPENYFCLEDPNVTLKDAFDRFSKGDRSELITSCFCDVRAQVDDVLSSFKDNRSITAPTLEINAALRDRSEAVVVVAGVNHLPHSRKLLKDKGVNYIVVAPKGLEENFPRALTRTNLDRLKNPLPNPDPKACEAWSKTPKAKAMQQAATPTKQEDAIIQWLMED